MRAVVLSGGDAPPVFDPSEAIFDFVALLVQRLVVGLRAFAVLFRGIQGSIPFSNSAFRKASLS